MTTLDDLLDVGDHQRDRARVAGRQLVGYLRVGVWSVGWLAARAVTLLLALVAGLFFALGWTCARSLPVLKWLKTAFVLGWEAGRPSGGGRVAA